MGCWLHGCLMGSTGHALAHSGILWHTLAYSCYIKAITGLDVLASWMPHGFDWASLMVTWGQLGHYLGMTWALIWQNLARLWHTLAHSGILWHTLAYSYILWHTLAYSVILWHILAYSGILWHTLAYFGILCHTLAYSSILWHTLAYSGILWHSLVYSGILWHILAYSGIPH